MNKKRFFSSLIGFIVASIAALIFITTYSLKTPAYADGEWTGRGEGRNGPIEISLTVKNKKIVDYKILSESETDFAKPAIKSVLDQLLAQGNIKSYDAVSGATISSKGTVEAIRNALNLASGKKEKVAKEKDTSCDIVIIGAGGAGLCASIEAKQKGVKNVILLEKMGVVGGNTTSATGGLNAAETRFQKELGIEDSKESFYSDTMKGGYNLNDSDLVHEMVNKASETVDWLVSIGVDLTDVGKMAGSTNKRTHRPQGGAAVGAHMIPVLESAAKTQKL